MKTPSPEKVEGFEMDEPPADFPATRPDGSPLKPITQVLLDRRATVSFASDEVPAEVLEAILRFGAQAPSGYNLQPWRFIVVRDRANRARLQRVAFNQAKIGEAPVVIIALGLKGSWRKDAERIFREGARRGAGRLDEVERKVAQAIQDLEQTRADVWVTRQTAIALTTMMLVAEAYGFDTVLLEGFDVEGVRREFDIPEEAEIVGLLAIGRMKGEEKPYPGRLPLREIVFEERYGRPWVGAKREAEPRIKDDSLKRSANEGD
jgi:nitroreductase